MGNGRYLETLAAGLAGDVPLIDESAIGIDGELLVATGDRQNTLMGESALGEGDHGDEIATDIIVMHQVVNPGICETSQPVIT